MPSLTLTLVLQFGQKNPQRWSGTPKFCNFCFCKIVFSKMGMSTLLAEKFCSLVFEGGPSNRMLAKRFTSKILCSTGAVLDCHASGEPQPDTVWVTAEGVKTQITRITH